MARGMTTREIQGHIEEIYGVEASPSLISAITDAVMDEVTAWQNRPLEPCYPIVFMDAIRVNIRSDGGGLEQGGLRGLGGPSGRQRETFWACGSRLMRARSSGPRCSVTCATEASKTSSLPSWTG